ncbi:unnamed protein product, partial [Closterium sp. NIES-54]
MHPALSFHLLLTHSLLSSLLPHCIRSSNFPCHVFFFSTPKTVSLPLSSQVAFRSYDFPRHVIILGGLTDGLLPTQYTARLASELAAAHWSLLQTQLSSSYFGYGASSLEQDAAEIDELIAYIIRRYHASEVVLVGHSTGCQVNTTENMVCQVNTTEELRQANTTEEHEVPGEYNRGVACPVNTTEDLTFQVNTTEGLRF